MPFPPRPAGGVAPAGVGAAPGAGGGVPFGFAAPPVPGAAGAAFPPWFGAAGVPFGGLGCWGQIPPGHVAPFSGPPFEPQWDTWVDFHGVRQAVDAMDFQEGDMVETVAMSQLGQVDGSALFKVVVCYGADMLGHFLEVES